MCEGQRGLGGWVRSSLGLARYAEGSLQREGVRAVCSCLWGKESELLEWRHEEFLVKDWWWWQLSVWCSYCNMWLSQMNTRTDPNRGWWRFCLAAEEKPARWAHAVCWVSHGTLGSWLLGFLSSPWCHLCKRKKGSIVLLHCISQQNWGLDEALIWNWGLGRNHWSDNRLSELN